jgi:hypothetical protein
MVMMRATTNYTSSGRKKRKRKAKGEVYRKMAKQPFVPMTGSPGPVRRDEGVHYKSAEEGNGVAVRVDSKQYTGDRKLLGIATMHKSNLVPVFESQDAKDIARMRRN